MKPEMHVRLSFGDLTYLLLTLRCVITHRSTRCLRQAARAKLLQLTGGDPTWEPFTVGDWVELRRWRAWADRDHEHEPRPQPWRHSRQYRRAPSRLEEVRPARLRFLDEAAQLRYLVLPGLVLMAVSLAGFCGLLLHGGHRGIVVLLMLAGAGGSTAVLRYVGRLQ